MEMKHLVLFLQLFLHLVAAKEFKECGEEETKEMHRSYFDCTGDAYDSFQERISQIRSENLLEIQKATCQYFVEADENCGKILESCYDKETIIDVKDNMIKDRLIQNGGQFSASCPTVKHFKQRKSRKQLTGNTKQDECSNEDRESVRTQMGSCANTAASNVHHSIENVTNPADVSDIVCHALTVIGKDCIKGLAKCFSIQDINELRKGTLKQFHEFLLKITEGKMEKESLKNCNVMNLRPIYFKKPNRTRGHLNQAKQPKSTKMNENAHVKDEPKDITNTTTEEENDVVVTDAAFQETNVDNVEVIPNIPTTKTPAQPIGELTQQSEDSTQHITENIQLTDKTDTIAQNKEDSGENTNEVKITSKNSNPDPAVNGANNERLTWPMEIGNGNISKLTTLTILVSLIINCIP